MLVSSNLDQNQLRTFKEIDMFAKSHTAHMIAFKGRARRLLFNSSCIGYWKI